MSLNTRLAKSHGGNMVGDYRQRGRELAYVIFSATLLLSGAAVAQYSPTFEEYEEVSNRGRTSVASGEEPAVKVPHFGPPAMSLDPDVGNSDSSPGSAAGSDPEGAAAGGCFGGDDEDSEDEPKGPKASQPVGPKMGSPSGAGGRSGACPGGIVWNTSPSMRTNPKPTDLTINNPANNETEGGNGWFLDRPRIIARDSTVQGKDTLFVRWNAHIFRKYINTSIPFNSAAGWKGSKNSTDEVIYQNPYPGGDYKLYDPTGKVYTFDAATSLVKDIASAGGERLIVTPNGSGLISTVEKQSDQSALLIKWIYTYNAANTKVISEIKAYYGTSTQPFRTITFKHKTSTTGPELNASQWDLIGIEDKWEPTVGDEQGKRTLNWAFRYYTDAWTSTDPGHPYQVRAVIEPYSFHNFR